MRIVALAVALAALNSQVSAGDAAVADRAEKLARMAQRIDVEAAGGEVVEWQNVLRYALANRDQDLAKKAREGLKNAKRDFAKAKERRPSHYMDLAKRVADPNIDIHPSKDPENRVSVAGLSAGELYLERIRHAGPLLISGATISRNSIGAPEVTIAVGNTTDRTIEAFDVEIECWNAFDEPVNALGDNIYHGTSQKPIAASEVVTSTWMLSVHPTTARVSVRVTRVKPSHGNVWEQGREEAERSPGAIVQATMRR